MNSKVGVEVGPGVGVEVGPGVCIVVGAGVGIVVGAGLASKRSNAASISEKFESFGALDGEFTESKVVKRFVIVR